MADITKDIHKYLDKLLIKNIPTKTSLGKKDFCDKFIKNLYGYDHDYAFAIQYKLPKFGIVETNYKFRNDKLRDDFPVKTQENSKFIRSEINFHKLNIKTEPFIEKIKDAAHRGFNRELLSYLNNTLKIPNFFIYDYNTNTFTSQENRLELFVYSGEKANDGRNITPIHVKLGERFVWNFENQTLQYIVARYLNQLHANNKEITEHVLELDKIKSELDYTTKKRADLAELAATLTSREINPTRTLAEISNIDNQIKKLEELFTKQNAKIELIKFDAWTNYESLIRK
jgi:hypothetical protein